MGNKGKKLLCGNYTSYTPTGSDLFKKAGRWHLTPEPGYVVYFWNASLGRIGHVGGVITVDKKTKTFTTVEGNSSGTEFTCNGGCVASHTYSYEKVGGTNRVQGFGAPVFGEDTCTVQEFIAMLVSQLGYEEKKSNSQLDDPHANAGDQNWTKYGKWYGLNPAQWCQMFISWCADQACEGHKPEQHTYPYWIHDGESWYYRIESGINAHGWHDINGHRFWFDEKGKMATDWKEIDGSWYYFQPSGSLEGAMYWTPDKTGKQVILEV